MSLQGNLGAIARMQPELESTIARKGPRSSSALPSSARAFPTARTHRDDRPLVTFQRGESDVRCFDITSQRWEMCDVMSNAFRFCRCVGSLQGLWYAWANCTFPGHVVVGPAMLVRISSTGEELSKYSVDDPRAVSKLGVVGPELDGNSSGSPSTTGATSLASALRTPSIVV